MFKPLYACVLLWGWCRLCCAVRVGDGAAVVTLEVSFCLSLSRVVVAFGCVFVWCRLFGRALMCVDVRGWRSALASCLVPRVVLVVVSGGVVDRVLQAVSGMDICICMCMCSVVNCST